MPMYEYLCSDCGRTSEILIFSQTDIPVCANCGSRNLKKLLSAHSSFSGTTNSRMPGPGDTACCGHSPGHAGCAGPGSCCGKGPF